MVLVADDADGVAVRRRFRAQIGADIAAGACTIVRDRLHAPRPGEPVGRKSPGSRIDECKKLAAALGRISSFSSRGKELSKRDLDNCNRGAR